MGTENERTSFVRGIAAVIYKWILNFNLFEERYNDAHGRRNEIITTRMYLILMILGLMVVIFYASVVEYSITYHVGKNNFASE